MNRRKRSSQDKPRPNSGKNATIIAIEGCVGAGKTTIAEGIAAFRASQLLLEDFAAVPFLKEFHRDPIGSALETEFAFLLQHYHQLRLAGRHDGEVVADFTFAKDLIFAEMNMTNIAERAIFQDLFRLLETRLPSVALTLFISASDELILRRIRARARSFEVATEPEYYRRLNTAYETFFAKHPGNIINVGADKLDFVADPSLFEWLSNEIDQRLDAQVA